jgi:spore coat polysaccharide biosynthesis protein SpsF (cytidylyltransferase family)
MTSTRLPGKVLMEIAGRPALELQLARLEAAAQLDEIAIATSVDATDDPVAELGGRLGVRVCRGPLHDVLARYDQAAQELAPDAVVRVTGDCPLIDPGVVDLVVERWRTTSVAYATNREEPRTYPVGMDTEVLGREVLAAAAREATDPYDREHVTPFVITRPGRFPAESVVLSPSLGHLRLTLDTPDDLEQLRAVAAGVADPVRAPLAELAAVAERL